jgi:hypothetical protein
MNWQRIFNGILSNLRVVVFLLVALSLVIKAIASSAKKSREERARKIAVERAKYEQLRTGRIAERSMLPTGEGAVAPPATIADAPTGAPRPIGSVNAERQRRIEELRRRQAAQRPGTLQPPRPQQPTRQEAPRRVQLPGGVVVDTSRPRQAPAKPTRQTTPASRPQPAQRPQPVPAPATGSSAVANALRQAQSVQEAGTGIVPSRGDAGARDTPAGTTTFFALNSSDPAQRRKALRDAVILSEIFGQPASARQP